MNERKGADWSLFNRYHAAHTLKTMKAFRIGRKPTGPWSNMTPPIRATTSQEASSTPSTVSECSDSALPEKGIFSNQGVLDSSIAAAEPRPDNGTTLLSEKSAAAEYGSHLGACLQTSSQPKPNSCSRRPSPSGALLQRQQTPPVLEIDDEKALEAARLLPRRGRKQMSPEEYTEWAMQQHRDLDMGEYPSLDHDVQLAITKRYLKLHEDIDAQGLYECHYINYAKEAVRYLTLFAVSMFALYKGWYLTSALFLGLFWVRCHPATYFPCRLTYTVSAPTHVYSPRCWSSGHYADF